MRRTRWGHRGLGEQMEQLQARGTRDNVCGGHAYREVCEDRKTIAVGLGTKDFTPWATDVWEGESGPGSTSCVLLAEASPVAQGK